MENEITICVTTHDNLEYTKATVLSFIKNTKIPYKLILCSDVNDGTREWTKTIPEIDYEHCTFTDIPFSGAAAARNANIKMATKIGNNLCILSDNDNIVPFGYDKYIFDILEKDPKIGFLMPLALDMLWIPTLHLSDKVDFIKQHKPNLKTAEELLHFPDFCYREYKNFDNYADKIIRDNMDIPLQDYCNTWSFFCFKLDVVNKVNGYDENFIGCGWEDLDFARRINLAGYRTAICSQSVIHHYMGTTRPFLPGAVEKETRNKEYYERKWSKP